MSCDQTILSNNSFFTLNIFFTVGYLRALNMLEYISHESLKQYYPNKNNVSHINKEKHVKLN